MSSNGPMRKPPPSRQMRSTCSGVAIPSWTIRSASSENGRLQRFTRKPIPSATSTTRRPIASAAARATATDSGDGVDARDDLDEPHDRRRVEEVHPDDALGRARRRADRGDRHRRGVRREDGLGVAGELAQQLALELQALGRGLDDELAAPRARSSAPTGRRRSRAPSTGRLPPRRLDARDAAFQRAPAPGRAARSPAPTARRAERSRPPSSRHRRRRRCGVPSWP